MALVTLKSSRTIRKYCIKDDDVLRDHITGYYYGKDLENHIPTNRMIEVDNDDGFTVMEDGVKVTYGISPRWIKKK